MNFNNIRPVSKAAEVYYIDFRASAKMNMLKKLRKLMIQARIENIAFDNKLVAIKIHFGEPGNLSYIRPNFAAEVVRMITTKGGIPFLTDANTLYKGRRGNAVDHLASASENGFNRLTTGCDVIIADGLKGTDYKEIEINQTHVKKAKIGAAIANADIIISMNHFKGHEMTGFGGALKNLGMGSGSVGGKLEMHSDAQPAISKEKCVVCGICFRNCAHGAINKGADNKAEIDYSKCVGCGQCVAVCQYEAAHAQGNSAHLQEKIAEYAYAVVKDKPTFHLNFIMNVSPDCDCWGHNDAAVVPDLGILASFDPVALDVASADMVNKAPINPNSCISGRSEKEDRFNAIHPTTNWKLCVEHAEAIGIGTAYYKLIKVE